MSASASTSPNLPPAAMVAPASRAPRLSAYETWRADLALLPEEAAASRRAAERIVRQNQEAAARFALTGAPITPDAAIDAIEAGLVLPVAMVAQPCQQQQGAARRTIAWRAVEVDLRADRAHTRPDYRQKWILSRGAWLAYRPSRQGPPTELLGMVRTGGKECVAVIVLFGGGVHEVARFPFDQPGLRAAKLALEARLAEGEAA